MSTIALHPLDASALADACAEHVIGGPPERTWYSDSAMFLSGKTAVVFSREWKPWTVFPALAYFPDLTIVVCRKHTDGDEYRAAVLLAQTAIVVTTMNFEDAAIDEFIAGQHVKRRYEYGIGNPL